jgi:hypothetical protein
MKRWDVIIDLLPTDKNIVGAEIGVLRGETSSKILEALPLSRLYMVDRWEVYPVDEREPIECNRMPSQIQSYFDKALNTAVKNVRPFRGRYKILKMLSLEAIKQINEKLDFVFIDARHDYDGCLADIKAWKTIVKKDGLIMGHDYGNLNHPGVTKAVDEQFKKIELYDDNVWVVRK